MVELQTNIEYLKGVGPQRADLLRSELSIHTFNDLMQHFPFRYVDRTHFHKISEISPDSSLVQIRGKLVSIEKVGGARNNRLVAQLMDETGTIELVWFKGIRYVVNSLILQKEFVVFGKPTFFKGKMNMAHPEINRFEEAREKLEAGLEPVYSTTEKLSGKGLNSKGMGKLMVNLFKGFNVPFNESLPDYLLEKYKLVSKESALRNIHFPKDEQTLKKAKARLKFEELFMIQLQIIRSKMSRKSAVKGLDFSIVADNVNDFYKNHLPFELTNAQKKVIKEIRTDLGSGKQMNRLLQGDVGSGKTIVALMCMLIAKDNGFQSALLAPTEILAQQHFNGLQKLVSEMNIRIELLTGSTKQSVRKVLFEDLLNGKIDILVGTHALLEDKVVFKNLGFSVIDEQHRFGVSQRSKLWKKSSEGRMPHILVMTATPIPRTLAMTFYGDLDVSVIDELPPGRKPIKTLHKFENSRLALFGFLKNEIEKGAQVYIVYPLIEESEKLDYNNLMEGYEAISRSFPLPKYKVSILHGKMKPEAKEYEMQRFANGETNILVSTTVIEVGVDVPNASTMVIESAERFGLSQLHQLRGRVGRGDRQSFCVLMTGEKISVDGKERMKTMVEHTDGFKIAAVDLRLRGPGDLLGTKQSGELDLKIANLIEDTPILKAARNEAIDILEEDPNLALSKNLSLLKSYKKYSKGKVNWSRIS